MSDKKPPSSNPKDINPNFDFKKSKITAGDIKEEANKHLGASPPGHNNPFPVQAFPPLIQQIISETNKSLNYPVDFIGSSMVYALSIAIGNKFRVKVKTGWNECAVIYIALVGLPGTNKSHPLSFALQPFLDLDAKSYKEYMTLKVEFEKAMANKKKGRRENEEPEIEKPHWTKFLVSDFTIEALATVHQYNLKGIGVYVDELAGWFKNFNRYNKGSEMEFWLSAWSGKPINVDRKTSDPINIQHPFISVGGTIQNGILTELAKDKRSHNGFLDRILFVIPHDLKKEPWSETEIDKNVIDQWRNILEATLNLTPGGVHLLTGDHETLPFSKDAWQVLSGWQIDNTARCNEAESESITGIYTKLETYVIRFALIFEILFYVCRLSDKKEISVNAVKAAIQLAEYFRNTALKVNAIINNYDPLERLPEDKRKLYEALPDTFTTEQAIQIGSGFTIPVPVRTTKRFLSDVEFFKWLSRGKYEKRI